MKKTNNLKLNNIIIVSILFLSMLINNVFAGANIIYQPTTSAILSTDTNYNDGTIISPESEVISTIKSDASAADNVKVYNIVEDGNGNYYCYDGGQTVKNAWRKISKYSFSQIGPTDCFPQDYIWAYFNSSGRAIRATSGKIRKTKIDNNPYAFNEYGMMLVGYFNDSGEMWNELTEEDPFNLLGGDNYLYHADENNGILTTGWLKLNSNTTRYENKNSIWLYFSPSNYRSVRATGSNYKSMNIDGQTYAFDNNGVMLTGFEATKYNYDNGGSNSKITYFSTDGSEIKNGFVQIDLNDDLNNEIYEDTDEDITIYLNKSGQMYYDCIKKINTYYYGFDSRGAVVKGLSVWRNGKYIATIDTESTNGKSFIVYGSYTTKDGSSGTLSSTDAVHYFDKNGRRMTSSVKLEFSDENYTYHANNSGGYNGLNNKKYYSHGLLLKPYNDAKYGICINNPTKANYSFSELCGNSNAKVVNSSGTVQTSLNGLKDDNECYWLLSSSGSYLINIYSVNVKCSGGTYYFKSANTNGNEAWIAFGTKDYYGYTCVTAYTANGTRLSSGAISNYQVRASNNSALNFNLN